jgi:rod shape-determining protein MreC
VINAGPNTTRVLRISDLNSRIAVASARSGSTAILAGDNSPLPKLSFINQRENWMAGDRVISSGDDGFLPRGLQIGEVVRGDGGSFRVQLSSLSQPLDWVWVSPFETLIAPPETVLETVDAP